VTYRLEVSVTQLFFCRFGG